MTPRGGVGRHLLFEQLTAYESLPRVVLPELEDHTGAVLSRKARVALSLLLRAGASSAGWSAFQERHARQLEDAASQHVGRGRWSSCEDTRHGWLGLDLLPLFVRDENDCVRAATTLERGRRGSANILRMRACWASDSGRQFGGDGMDAGLPREVSYRARRLP